MMGMPMQNVSLITTQQLQLQLYVRVALSVTTYTSMIMMLYLQVLVGYSVLIATRAFVVVPTKYTLSSVRPSSSFLQVTKKRRRKRTDDPNSSESSSFDEMDDMNDLPDFDLGEGGQDSEKTPTSKKPKRKTTNPDEITLNMMASSSNQPARSIEDLLRDRSLERKFEFDEPGDESLPDLADLARPGQGQGVSRKEQRRQAAVARDASQPEEKEPLQLPFEMTNAKGEIQFNKVLEAGAWLGIFLLVGWEVYINSPFFDRAAPMAPIVYDTPP